MYIKMISWNVIKNVWENKLWIGRKTPIKPTNGLLLYGGYDKSVENNKASFFGLFKAKKLVGVNSGHSVNNKYRSRGLYVEPEYRHMGGAQLLLKATEDQAKLERKDILWSIPRESSLQTYIKFGFKVVGSRIEDLEFGPNYYVVKKIKKEPVIITGSFY